MAEPQKRAATGASIVGSCTATDCTFNEERECHAGEIVIQINGRQAECGTYSPETPRARP